MMDKIVPIITVAIFGLVIANCVAKGVDFAYRAGKVRCEVQCFGDTKLVYLDGVPSCVVKTEHQLSHNDR